MEKDYNTYEKLISKCYEHTLAVAADLARFGIDLRDICAEVDGYDWKNDAFGFWTREKEALAMAHIEIRKHWLGGVSREQMLSMLRIMDGLGDAVLAVPSFGEMSARALADEWNEVHLDDKPIKYAPSDAELP